MPSVTHESEPELAVLSAIAHGADADPERAVHVALAALAACLAVTEEQRTRILACLDVTTLERWVRKSVSVSATDDLFD